jgi:hypothetical protein
MWYRFKNFLFSLKTYGILSPELRVRRQVNQRLYNRSSLAANQWFQLRCQPLGISRAIANFAYTRLATYSGLEFSRVLLSDRLEEDLRWTQVCWFDWEIALCDDFCEQFGVDISDRLDAFDFNTVAELLTFLNQQLNYKSSTQELF